jgi:hypothetical protein
VTGLNHPRILQIVREPLKPGSEAAYDAIERDQARISRAFGCPHPYLAAESLTGPKEVWWFNAYESDDDRQQVYDAYAKNARLLEALQKNGAAKTALTWPAIEVFARYRSHGSGDAPWTVGRGRFLVIAVTRDDRAIDGTVFEAADGTRYAISAARSRADAEALGPRAGAEATIFAVRPDWSFPDSSWLDADPRFWAEQAGRH